MAPMNYTTMPKLKGEKYRATHEFYHVRPMGDRRKDHPMGGNFNGEVQYRCAVKIEEGGVIEQNKS